MRIVVIGASGNIGTAVIDALTGQPLDLDIVAVARRLPAKPRAGTATARIRWTAADITRDPLDGVVADADVVVNLAWVFHPSHHPQRTWRANIGGALRLLEAVRRAKVSALVHSSSIAAYSARLDEGPVDETWPTHGASPAAYVREKSYLERALDTFELGTPSCRVVRMRPAFVFHRRAASQQRRLFAGPFIPGRLLVPGLLPLLPMPKGLILQTIHADDVAAAFVAAVLGGAHGPFNLCADSLIRPADLAELFKSRLRTLPAGVFAGMLRAAWVSHLAPAHPYLFDALMQLPVMSNQRAKDELGWTPHVTALAAIEDFLEGLRLNEGYPTPPLDPSTGGRVRWREFATGIGSKE